MIQVIIFDWGDTLMHDFPNMEGPMCFWPAVQLVDGVSEALEQLGPGLIRCVASNAGASDADLMGRALERVGIRHHFHHLFTSKELGVAKPATGFFEEVARRAGADPAACVMVGNDLEKDIAGARRAGMQTIWLAGASSTGIGDGPTASAVLGSGQGARVEAGIVGPASLVIASMRQLPDAVRLLARRSL